MCQAKIVNYLEKNKGKETTAKEIAEKIKCNLNTTRRSLRKLRYFGEVRWKLIKGFGNPEYVYFIK